MRRLLRSLWLLVPLVLAGPAACTDSAKPPPFKTTDITGADFGKGFALTDHNGTPRTLADFKGKVVVMFFGFTHCPDVCPGTLNELALVKQQLGADGDKVQVLFVTLDPERDTPLVLSIFVPAFDPSFLGLYGDPATIDKTAKDYKVFHQRVPGSTPGNYTLDHTAAAFIYDSQGRLRLFGSLGQGPDALVHDIRLLLTESA